MMLVGLCRRAVLRLTAVIFLASISPCAAYLMDAGSPQHAGVGVRDNSSCVWAAEPFRLDYDAYVTALGAAVARAMGPADAGFDVYLSATTYGLPSSAIAKLPNPLVPLNTQYVYYDGALSAPVFLTAGIYYLVFMPTSTSFYGSISYAVKPGIYYGQRTADYGQSWYMLAYPLAVRVDGWFVPEPSSVGIVVAGVLGLVALRRRTS